MHAGRYRTGFALNLLILALLLFFFSKTFLLQALVILAALALALFLMLRADARQLKLEVQVPPSSLTGAPLPATLRVNCERRLRAAKYAVVDLEICSTMFDDVQRLRIQLPLKNGAQYDMQLDTALCGRTVIRCAGVRVWELLELFSAAATPFSQTEAILYPQRTELQLRMPQASAGSSNVEGLMQNRRGNDLSEIYNIREYMPGDDVRAIHWKLTCKTDTLILREASDPAHYDLALLPDIGLAQRGKTASQAECNASVSITIAIARQLLRRGKPFCLALVTKQGLALHEVRNEHTLDRLLPQWLSTPVPPLAGVGLECFLAERLEQYFTRLVIVSAGEYARELGGLETRIGVSIVSAADTDAASYAAFGLRGEVAVLPTKPSPDEKFRILC